MLCTVERIKNKYILGKEKLRREIRSCPGALKYPASEPLFLNVPIYTVSRFTLAFPLNITPKKQNENSPFCRKIYIGKSYSPYILTPADIFMSL